MFPIFCRSWNCKMGRTRHMPGAYQYYNNYYVLCQDQFLTLSWCVLHGTCEDIDHNLMPEWSDDKDAREISASRHSFREILLAWMGFFEALTSSPTPLSLILLKLPGCSCHPVLWVQLPALFRGADEKKNSQDTRSPSSHQAKRLISEHLLGVGLLLSVSSHQ